jgi:hypothetical protein
LLPNFLRPCRLFGVRRSTREHKRDRATTQRPPALPNERKPAPHFTLSALLAPQLSLGPNPRAATTR